MYAKVRDGFRIKCDLGYTSPLFPSVENILAILVFLDDFLPSTFQITDRGIFCNSSWNWTCL